MNRQTLRKAWPASGPGFVLYEIALIAWRGEPPLDGLFGNGILASAVFLTAFASLLIAGGRWLAQHSWLGEVAAWKSGTLFGIAAYWVVYGLVLPLARGTSFPDPDKLRAALDLFPYVFLIGIPLFAVFRKTPPLS